MLAWNGKDISQLKPHSLTHPPICTTHSLSLSLYSKQARTLETREGRDWRKNWRRWRRGRRGASEVAHGHPQPLHGELKRNHLHFLDSSPNGLIHGFVCKIEDLLLVVVPSYVSKSKEFSPSSFIQQVHGYSFDPFLVYIVRGNSYEAKPSLDGECVSEGSLDLQPIAMEALRF